jgi:hypothetical protein
LTTHAIPLHPSILLPDKPFNIPRSLSPQLQSARSLPIQFFLKFHRERITEAHYFRWYDYPKLCTRILFSLAEISDSLRHAMVGFSALIYSYKFHQGARQVGLFYYEKALQELRLFLNPSKMEIVECLMAVATALQLSSFDVCPLSQPSLMIISASMEIRRSVFGILKARPLYYKKRQLRLNYVQRSSDAHCSNGTYNWKTIVVF